MHDPLVVAFDIRRPWPKRCSPLLKNTRWHFRGSHWAIAGWWIYWPSFVTVWHREPGGHDSGEVCKHYDRVQDANGKWDYRFHHRWRFHVHHWKVQIHPLQEFRRWLLTRCEWCGGPSRKGDYVNVSHQWGGARGPWWRGARGVFHMDCSSVEHAHRRCVCESAELSHTGYGKCARCGLFRAWREPAEPNEPTRLLKSLPLKSRIPADLKPRLEELWREVRAEKERAS
jgi:hypothetical protein